MAKKMYIGVGGLAKKVKKAYIGADGTARKVKKGYIGVGGVARPFFSGGEIAYFGTATPLTHAENSARGYAAAAAVGDYALFAGGLEFNAVGTVDAYSSLLVKQVLTNISNVYYLAGTSISDTVASKNYALFSGGTSGSGVVTYGIKAFDPSLTQSTVSGGLTESKYTHAAASAGSVAMFAGGRNSSKVLSSADSLNSSLTKTILSPLTEAKTRLAAAAVGDYVLFAGGFSNTSATAALSSVDCYSRSLVKGTASPLSSARGSLAGVTAGGRYAIFAGGDDAGTVDAYDATLTKTTPASLGYKTVFPAAASLGDFALIAGGDGGTAAVATTICFDSSLVKSVPAPLSVASTGLSATSVGNYALFAGGDMNAMVDVYMISE